MVFGVEARRTAVLLAVCLFAGAAPGCSGGGGAAVDGSSLTSSDLLFIDCSKEGRATPYAAGTVVKSADGEVAIELVENRPGTTEDSNPPGAWVKGSNNWTIEVRDAAEQPVGGLQIGAVPRMPDHMHGTPVTPVTTEKGDGRYVISPLYFYMSGYWQVTLDVRPSSDGGTTLGRETVVFHVCIPG